ncbi:hypothetical protein IWQ56_005887, partial [Coemansia nantahalensis]
SSCTAHAMRRGYGCATRLRGWRMRCRTCRTTRFSRATRATPRPRTGGGSRRRPSGSWWAQRPARAPSCAAQARSTAPSRAGCAARALMTSSGS